MSRDLEYNYMLNQYLLYRGDNSLSANNPSATSTGKSSSSSSSSHHHQQQQQQQPQSMSGYESSPRQRHVSAHHGYSDSTLSSGRSSDDGKSSYFSHSRQELADMYGSVRSSHESHTSSGEEPHSRSNSHDSTDYTMSGWSLRSHLTSLISHRSTSRTRITP